MNLESNLLRLISCTCAYIFTVLYAACSFRGCSRTFLSAQLLQCRTRHMKMSPLYPCGKPCTTGSHNKTVKKLNLFSAIISGITVWWNHGFKPKSCRNVIAVIQSNWEFYHICHNHSNSQISQSDCTLGIPEFGHKEGHVFQSNVMSLCWPKHHHPIKGTQRNKGLQVISLS